MITSQPIHALSLDLDGTLLRKDGSISDNTIETLKKCEKHGIRKIFNTARPKNMVSKEILEEFKDDVWIFSNGTTAIHKNQVLFHHTLHKKHSQSLINELIKLGEGIFFSVEVNGRIFSPSKNDYMMRKYFAEKVLLENFYHNEINKIIIVDEDKDYPIEHLYKLENENVRLLITEKGKYLQFMPKNISKLTAIESVGALMGFDLSNVLAFGDDNNDYEIIKFAGTGVAMANATVDLKNIADYVTLSNDREGVSVFLKEHLFESKIHLEI